MVFDAEARVVNGFRDDERKLLAGITMKGPYDSIAQFSSWL